MFLHYRRVIAAALISLAAVMLTARAQTRRTPGSVAVTGAAQRTGVVPPRRMTSRVRPTKFPRAKKPTTEQPVNFLSGDASVLVQGDKPQLIPLGLTYNRVLVIEFPASDRFFRWHGGNSRMIYIDDSPTKKTDNFIVLRAVPPHKENPAGFNAPVQLSIQMKSGLVVPFMIYPTREEARAAYRCVLRYDRDEVMRMRRAEGLAVNLGVAESPAVPTEVTSATAALSPTPVTNPTVTLVSAALPIPVPPPIVELSNERTARPETAPEVSPVVAEIERKAKKSNDKGGDPNEAAKSGLAAAIREPKQFKRWTPPLHGLAVATIARDVNERSRLVIVAVRNMNTQAVRIMPGHPDIYIETFGEGGKPVQVERVKRLLHTETTTESRVLPAGATVYYALVFETPILGVNQHLRIAVGQTNAADEPTAADLTAAAR